MAIFKYNNVRISAMSACVPSKVYDNTSLDYLMPKEDVSKLISTIGITERRLTDEHTCASDLCYKAAKRLIDDNNIDVTSIDMLLFLSISPDYITPPTSAILQHRLGLSTNAACMDLSMACTGFIYALSTSYAYASLPNINKVLLLVGETMTKYANPKDKVNFPIYGDAGTATLIEKGGAKESIFSLTTDGSGEEFVRIPTGGQRNRVTKESLIDNEYEDGNFRKDIDITMDGMTTFNHAITCIPKQIKALIKEAEISYDDVDYLVSHQANKFMIDFIIKRLKFNPDKVPFCIEKYGNTSCASVPLTIVSELSNKLEGDKSLLLSAIGAGWSFGTAFIRTKDIKVSPVIEY